MPQYILIMLLQKSSTADHTDWRLQMNTNLSTTNW